MLNVVGHAQRVKRALARLLADPPKCTHTPPRTYAYLGGNRALTQLSTGAPFFVNTDDRGISPWIILGGHWETFVDDILTQLAKPGMAFLDIGANMGYYSAKIGSLVGQQGRVYSFEPNPELYSFLVDNVNINGLRKQASTWNLALSDQPGRADLHFGYHNMGGGSLGGKGASTHTVSVEVDTLDRLLAPGTRVDLIKIDAEGFEPKILLGAQRVLRENPGLVMILEVSLGRWQKQSDPAQVFNDVIGQDKEVFQIQHSGKMVPMGSPGEFLGRISPGFVSYCLILPQQSAVRQELSAFISVD